jgi:hypothetical protein
MKSDEGNGWAMDKAIEFRDCQYLVLDVGTEQLDWRYMDGVGTAKRQGQFQKSTVCSLHKEGKGIRVID